MRLVQPMAEPRRATLLQLAIGASMAVLPVLLAVLLVVAVLRPAEAPGEDAGAERYENVRLVAALQTFEQAIVPRARVVQGPPDAAALLDGLPECRAEWAASDGRWDALLRGLGLRDPQAPAPAQRHAARLAEIDQALARFSTRDNRRVQGPVGLDAGRWFVAARQALQVPLRPPGQQERRFQLRCADLAAAIAALGRDGGRMIEALAWRGTEPAAVVARWRPDQLMQVPARTLARSNPWGGLPGCVYLGAAGAAGGFAPTHYLAAGRDRAQAMCADAVMAGAAAARPSPAGPPGPSAGADDPDWSVPPALSALLAPLDTIRRPSGTLYRAYTEPAAEPSPLERWVGGQAPADPTGYRYGPNRITLDGAVVDVGFSVDLTIDPALQALAQKTAACYTGQQAACRMLGIARREDGRQPVGHRLLERAVVRMAAVAVVDVDSGRIEALAGALSPCARQELDGPGRGRECDARLPYPVRFRGDALLNPAVHHDAMPASTIKPIMAMAFLTDPQVGARWLAAEQAAMRSPEAAPVAGLRAELMRSASKAFLDRMFCADRGYADCDRPQRIQAAAARLGWNTGCSQAGEACGRSDLLFGRPLDAGAEAGRVRPLAAPVAYGRLLVEPADPALGAAFRLTADPSPVPAAARQCAAGADAVRPSDDDWEKCRVAGAVDAVAEGWGQGNARATALGAAGMMAALAAAANGQPELRRPHLVRGLRGVGERGAPLESAVLRWSLAAPEPMTLPREPAEVILNGLSWSHRAGTARLACEQVFDARTCSRIDWIAGKTGTPTFPNDARTLDELGRLCRARDTAAAAAATAVRHETACGPLRPYKWYVAAWRPPGGDGRWTKAIAVLTERNWVAQTGRIHGAGDQGPNPAAEIALQIAARQLGALPAAKP